MISFVFSNNDFSKAIQYIFETLIRFITDEPYEIIAFNTAQVFKPREGLVISYGKTFFELECSKRIHIYESSLFGTDYLSTASLPEIPLQRYGQIPIIYKGVKQVEEHFSMESDVIKTDIDILASSFFMLTRYEEVVSKTGDKMGRFCGKDSLAYKEGFIYTPVVNQYIELLYKWIIHLYPQVRRRYLWGEKDFAVFISHDVDHIRKFRSPYPLIRYLIFERNIRKFLSAVGNLFKAVVDINNDPAYSFEYICGLEKKYGIKSTYYWMTSSSYRVRSHNTRKWIQKLSRMDNEIGLHPSINTYNNAENLSREKNLLEHVLENKIEGCRQHYLQISLPLTWRIQEQLGFTYDASVGFHDIEGYRCGICYPYQVFDIEKNNRLNLVEIPLIIMDTTLQSRYSKQEAFEIIKRHIHTCRKFKGLLSMLWHNDALDKYDWKGNRELFERVMDYIYNLKPLSLSGRGIINNCQSLWKGD